MAVAWWVGEGCGWWHFGTDHTSSVPLQAPTPAAEGCTSGTAATTAEMFTSGTVLPFPTGTFASQIAFGFLGAFM